jgi:hypothetical protein
MNARSIKRILMHNRVEVFWGDRAYLTIRFGTKTFPEQYPRFSAKQLESIGQPSFLEENWEKSDPKQNVDIWTTISKIYGFHAPEENETRTIYNVKSDNVSDYSWYEGYQRIFKFGSLNNDSVSLKDNFIEQRALDKKFIEKHIAQKKWERKYIWGVTKDPHYITDLILYVLDYCKTAYFYDDETSYLLVFAVKWFYPDEKLRFCSNCAKLLRELKRIYPKARILKRSV